MEDVVTVDENETNLPRTEDLPIPPYVPPPETLSSVETMVSLITEGLGEIYVDNEEGNEGANEGDNETREASQEMARQILRARLNIAPLSERAAILRPIIEIQNLEEQQFNLELFRLLGPANPFYNSQALDLENGGPRMFLAMDFDNEDGEEIVSDWFLGYCEDEECQRRIRRRWHAVRMPRPMGGWLGCFCSFECLRNGISTHEESQNQPELATRAMVDSLQEQLEVFGIQDRLI